MTGTTDSKSHNLIKNFVRENPDVNTLILQAMPGTQDMDTNRRVVMDLRAAGLATHVPADGRIASGAVDWFIAGNPRTIECGAMIGVHSWGSKRASAAIRPFMTDSCEPSAISSAAWMWTLIFMSLPAARLVPMIFTGSPLKTCCAIAS